MFSVTACLSGLSTRCSDRSSTVLSLLRTTCLWCAGSSCPPPVCLDGFLPADARALLQRAGRQRLRMSEGMTYEGCKVSPANVIAAVDSYFPSIWQITASMEAAASTNVKLTKPLVFEWTSVLCNNETADAKAKKEKQPMTNKGRKLWRNNVLVYEVTEMLVVKALALYNQAGITVGAVAADDTSQHTAAATSLRQGAGAMDGVGTVRVTET